MLVFDQPDRDFNSLTPHLVLSIHFNGVSWISMRLLIIVWLVSLSPRQQLGYIATGPKTDV